MDERFVRRGPEVSDEEEEAVSYVAIDVQPPARSAWPTYSIVAMHREQADDDERHRNDHDPRAVEELRGRDDEQDHAGRRGTDGIDERSIGAIHVCLLARRSAP